MPTDTTADPDGASADLPELRAYLRSKKAALAGFMELGAGLELSGETLKVIPRTDIYIRYLSDHQETITALASEFYGRPIVVELGEAAPADAQTETDDEVPPPSSGSGEAAPPKGRQPTPSNPNWAARRRLKHDITEMERTLRRLSGLGEVVEVRALECGPRNVTIAGYFDHDHLAEAAKLAGDLVAGGIYTVLNPVQPSALARAANHLVERPKTTTTDADIVRRRWLLLDFDPRRVSGVSATDAEKAAAMARAEACREYLAERGWIAPIFADSGNGGHLQYPIDLPNDLASRGLIERVLKALALTFSDDQVDLDLSVFNAARICKLYGSVSGKGDSTEDRPHRLSRVLDDPDLRPGEIVTLDQLKAIADLLPEDREPSRRGGRGQPFDINAWLQGNSVPVGAVASWQGGRKWLVTRGGQCLFGGAHDGGGNFIVQFASGAIAAGCHHNSCAGKSWKDLRETYEPGCYDDPKSRTNEGGNGTAAQPKAKPKASDRSSRASDVAAARIHSVWAAGGKPDHVYLARGKVFSIEGDPGNGKSALVVDLLARKSAGTPFPDGWKCNAENVIYISAEDDAADTIRPRLEAAGADLDRVRLITTEHGLLTLPKELRLLHDLIREDQAAIVALDPIDAFLDGTIDANKNQSIRTVLVQLSQLAHVTRTVIAFVRHLNKQADNGRAMYRGSGSIAFTAACRGVYLVGPDPNDPDRRVFACTKNNIGPKPPALGYRIVGATCPGPDDGEIRTMRIEWLGPVEFTLDDLVRPTTGKKPRGPEPEKIQAAQESFSRCLPMASAVPTKLAGLPMHRAFRIEP